MQITRSGVTLKSITQADLEQIRIWRNSEFVRPYMSFDQEVSPAMQQKWFRELDLSKNLYFTICINNNSIGVINLKDINRQLNTAEAGIFIGDTGYINTTVPVLATITLMKFAFDVLGLSYLRAKIRADNTKVIRFNTSIGYVIEDHQEDLLFQYYSTNKQQFACALLTMKFPLAKENNKLTVEYSPGEQQIWGITWQNELQS